MKNLRAHFEKNAHVTGASWTSLQLLHRFDILAAVAPLPFFFTETSLSPSAPDNFISCRRPLSSPHYILFLFLRKRTMLRLSGCKGDVVSLKRRYITGSHVAQVTGSVWQRLLGALAHDIRHASPAGNN
jgi:hypothetical protein